MPTFLHPALLWGLGIAAIPVLIHLINMMRHRRVEWAAMEFLLLSQKKHRTWIVFKQLLLLLLRVAAVVAVVLMVAQPRLSGPLSNLLGGTRTHHIVLLDDSFSMSDRWADTDAFTEAKKVVDRIGINAVRQNRLQSYTLLRFSRSGLASRRIDPDLLKQPITTEFTEKLTAILAKLHVTQTAAGPLGALQAVGKLLGDNDGEQRIFYLISDFRARQWDEPAELSKAMQQLAQAGAEIHLIDCVDRARPNLAIVSLAPVEGIHAAGVPWSMEVAVKNFGAAPPGKFRSRWARTATAGRPSRWRKSRPAGRPRNDSRCDSPMPERIRSPRGWRAMPWPPTTIALRRSTCQPTCRHC